MIKQVLSKLPLLMMSIVQYPMSLLSTLLIRLLVGKLKFIVDCLKSLSNFE